MFYLIFNHYFEYYYVWQHSNTIMPMRYILACFWEGQEGSFLLWIFWDIIISFFLIRKQNTWGTPVMAIIMSVQVFLCSMILGVYVFDYNIGTNAFILLREHPDFASLPFVALPDYLSKINDGRGLNPLLQNYWMVIHPPILFLGFASTVVPFAYALGGLITRKTTEWIKPSMPWTFFSVMVLGTGILMGAAWAYESLSFGGFWAWDPVENASLVPWITLVAAAHVMIIYNHKGHSLFSVFLLTIMTFLLVLYSTFLTRSGILGDTSVHAFTDLGMSGQLVIYMAFFVLLAGFLLIRERKKIISPREDDSITSREFWMYIGALVLVISSLQITFTTSIPVINKIFSAKLAPPAEKISHSQKQIISQNVKGVNLGKDFPNRENILIELHSDTLPMGEYFVCYKGKSRAGVNLTYTIEYFKENPATGKKEKQFELHPVVQLNERMGNVSEPSTKRFLSRDIYTHITYAALDDLNNNPAAGKEDEYGKPSTHVIGVGDTITASNSLIVLTRLNKNMDKASLGLGEKDLAVGAQLSITDIGFNHYQAEPVFVIKDMVSFSKDATLDTLGLKFGFTRIDPEKEKMEIVVSEKKSQTPARP